MKNDRELKKSMPYRGVMALEKAMSPLKIKDHET